MTKPEVEGLAKLREPFAPHHISKLPKPTKAQTDQVKENFSKGKRCTLCGGWHHPDVVHLDYVGHAALTDRLLDVDELWTWEPVAFTEAGLPAFDATGGLWIRLTVLGVTRLGYGHAAAKNNADPGSREKEVIGDALRNAAMRFGAALDLWHKGDLHADEDRDEKEPIARAKLDGPHTSKTALREAVNDITAKLRAAQSLDELKTIIREAQPTIRQAQKDWPILISGNPEIPEDVGLDGAYGLRRAELDPDNMVSRALADMKETAGTPEALDKWLGNNAAFVETLDGADARRFQNAYDAYAADLTLRCVNAG